MLVDGEIVGAWGRRGGRVEVKITSPVPGDVGAEMECEVASMPIADQQMSLSVTEF